MSYRLTALLAILQQAEYDRPTFWRWVRTKRSAEETKRLNQTQPERWTPKLRLIRSFSSWLQLILGAPRGVAVSAWLVSLPQSLVAGWILARAARRLRSRQSAGLTVIAVAGSYGKTSVKYALRHLLSTRHYTLMTPESVNTPLGIAAIINRSLTDKHSTFIVEFGEQKPGDLKKLMAFVQPDIVVVTPIGYAHGEYLGSEKAVAGTFAELNLRPPALFIIDDRNREVFAPKAETIWYGTQEQSAYRLLVGAETIGGTRGRIVLPGTSAEISAPLLGAHQLVNHLPGLVILNLDRPAQSGLSSLRYSPAVPRRLEVHHNANGTVVIDNSYNTNPGSWKQMKQLIAALSLGKVVIVTAGFVELEQGVSQAEHQQLADDLKQFSGAVILRTRYNAQLREKLADYAAKHPTFRYGETDDLDKGLALISREGWPLDAIWLEGGCRELYQ